jgi:TonB-dependent SusC/RagA subfamily outer membrane receptor
LGEIVVTGAGTATETEKLGNVRNNVSADQIEKSNESNVVEALAAKAPNVFVSSQSGDPGASSFIQIRGVRTIVGNNQPLFIVDGVPINNAATSTSSFNPHDGGYPGEGTVVENRAIDMNPNDIESVEILKGAAAGAIYGARAGQGVVLISTKSGHAGATHFSFRSRQSSARAASAFMPTHSHCKIPQVSWFMVTATMRAIAFAGAPGDRSCRRVRRCSLTPRSCTRPATWWRTR